LGISKGVSPIRRLGRDRTSGLACHRCHG
jgi:hypothetical protein